MTNEEAIKQLEELIEDRKSFCEGDDEHDETYRSDIVALRRAVKALDIRTPKKPPKDLSPLNKPYCPSCKAMQQPRVGMTSFCVWCGQALDWR